MDYMQYNPQTSLQTQESRQMGMFVHLAGLINTFAFPFGIIAVRKLGTFGTADAARDCKVRTPVTRLRAVGFGVICGGVCC